jgi:GNAT superfamily N-acetyltransferase
VNKLTRLRDTVATLGFANALCTWIDNRLNRVSRGRVRLMRYLFLVQPLSPEPRVAARNAARIPVRMMTAADVAGVAWPVPARVIERRLANGSVSFIAEIRGEFAGYLWIHCGPYEEDEVRCTFVPTPGDTTAWDFDVYVEPRFRTTRVFARLWDTASAHLRERGYLFTASRVAAYNVDSLRAHARLGGAQVGSAIFVTVFGLQLLIAGRTPFVRVTTPGMTTPSLPIRVAGNGAP